MQPVREKIFLASNPSNPDSPTYKTFEFFNEKLAKIARVDFGNKYKQGEEIGRLRDGSLALATISMADICNLIDDPICKSLITPFTISSYQDLTAAYDGPVGAYIFNIVREKLGIEILAPLYIGTRCITLKDPDLIVTRPQDLAHVRLRVPAGKSWNEVAKSLGAQPVPVGISGIAAAYEKGEIDGHENPPSATVAYKLVDYVGQMVLTNHLVDSVLLSMSRDAWESLTPQEQVEVRAFAAETRTFNDAMRQEEETATLNSLADRVKHIDLDPFKAL